MLIIQYKTVNNHYQLRMDGIRTCNNCISYIEKEIDLLYVLGDNYQAITQISAVTLTIIERHNCLYSWFLNFINFHYSHKN